MATVLAVSLSSPLEHNAHATSGDGVTIADVAYMAPNKMLSYVLDVTAARGLEIGKQHGDGVLNCLKKEFVGIKKRADSSLELPRGVDAAIKLVRRHYHNGGRDRLAAKQIVQFVDLVAERACEVDF